LQPERSLSHNPIVQILFVMQNIPRVRRDLARLELTSFKMPVTKSKFDLAVFMAEAGDELIGHWLHSSDLFDEKTIGQMASHFETLLQNAAAQPDTRLSALEMFSEEEKLRHEAERKQRKKSQLRKLMTVELDSVGLSSSGRSSWE
jgi:non-ribosomal peptide synthetase component F